MDEEDRVLLEREEEEEEDDTLATSHFPRRRTIRSNAGRAAITFSPSPIGPKKRTTNHIVVAKEKMAEKKRKLEASKAATKAVTDSIIRKWMPNVDVEGSNESSAGEGSFEHNLMSAQELEYVQAESATPEFTVRDLSAPESLLSSSQLKELKDSLAIYLNSEEFVEKMSTKIADKVADKVAEKVADEVAEKVTDKVTEKVAEKVALLLSSQEKTAVVDFQPRAVPAASTEPDTAAARVTDLLAFAKARQPLPLPVDEPNRFVDSKNWSMLGPHKVRNFWFRQAASEFNMRTRMGYLVRALWSHRDLERSLGFEKPKSVADGAPFIKITDTHLRSLIDLARLMQEVPEWRVDATKCDDWCRPKKKGQKR